MVWEGGGGYSLAVSLKVLLGQLFNAYPDPVWQNSAETGTIGDAAHRAEGSASDHNPWLNHTVRAADIARTANGPDCESLFRMVNKMYAAHDPRVYPDGYAIFNGRITDWDNPGGYHAQQGDPHTEHCHISTSTKIIGYNSSALWPLGNEEPDVTVEELHAALDRYFKGDDGHLYRVENLVLEALKPRLEQIETNIEKLLAHAGIK